jgi:hypothetical protein
MDHKFVASFFVIVILLLGIEPSPLSDYLIRVIARNHWHRSV